MPHLANAIVLTRILFIPLPRRLLVDDERPGAFHVIFRCVRRVYLCGNQAEHRRAWVTELIRRATGAFAVDVLSYAVMSNHLHIVVLTDPEAAPQDGKDATMPTGQHPPNRITKFAAENRTQQPAGASGMRRHQPSRWPTCAGEGAGEPGGRGRPRSSSYAAPSSTFTPPLISPPPA